MYVDTAMSTALYLQEALEYLLTRCRLTQVLCNWLMLLLVALLVIWLHEWPSNSATRMDESLALPATGYRKRLVSRKSWSQQVYMKAEFLRQVKALSNPLHPGLALHLLRASMLRICRRASSSRHECSRTPSGLAL